MGSTTTSSVANAVRPNFRVAPAIAYKRKDLPNFTLIL
jgi:hypothetical protein